MNVNQFLEDQNRIFRDLLTTVVNDTWMAQTNGEKMWADKLADSETKFNVYYSDRELYEKICTALENSKENSLEKRQLQLFLNMVKDNQLPEETITELSKLNAELNYMFNTYLPELDGKKLSANDIREILIHSNDNQEREQAWKASKEVGKVVHEKLLKAVKMRNNAARELGYDNYYQMAFSLQELDLDEVFSTFQNLVELSSTAYKCLKEELDKGLAKRFGVNVQELRPWHYADPFFQHAPTTEETNLDIYFKDKDILQLNSDTFNSMGIDITDLYDKSDLFPREGKNPTAFCIDMDRSGDTRVVCNITPTSYWMATTLHEFGHAAYNKFIDPELPFVLRQAAHTLTTEAIAMLFGKMVNEEEWLQKVLKMDKKNVEEISPALRKYQQIDMLVAARFIMTFVFFERELYENPDQDLNSLWWKLVEDIQLISAPENRNEPDWAAKIHFTLSPVYYQNYLLGELTASQLHEYITKNISDEFFTKEVGEFIKKEFFKPGATYHWNEKIERVTGQPLNPQHFVKMFCQDEIHSR